MYQQVTRSAIGIAVLLTLSTNAFAAEPLGQLKSSSPVEVVSGGISTIVDNDVHPIFAGDIINTMADSSALIRFTGDVGFVEASNEASVTVDKAADTFDITVEGGQTQFMFLDQQDFIVHAECLNIEAADSAPAGDTLTGGFVTILDDGQGLVRSNESNDLQIKHASAGDVALLAADTESEFNLSGCSAGTLAAVMGTSDTVVPSTVGVNAATANPSMVIPEVTGAAGAATAGGAVATTAVIGTVAVVGGGIIVAGGTKSNPPPASGQPTTPTPGPTVTPPATPQPQPAPSNPPRPPITPPASPVMP